MRQEIEAGRCVVVSLDNHSGGWHMYVVYSYDPASDEFKGVTEVYNGSSQSITDVKQQIINMKGTDILTYSI